MEVVINGSPQELDSGATVQTVVASLPDVPQGRGLAVALDGEVIPRGQWGSTELHEGARVEVVVAVQGG